MFHPLHFFSALQHKPVCQMGMKHTVSEFLVAGWQDDNLQSLWEIQYIVVVSGNSFLLADLYVTQGILWHCHSSVVQTTSGIGAYYLSELAKYQPLQAHQQSNDNLWTTFYSHIENTSILDVFVYGCSQLSSSNTSRFFEYFT